jgi:hypothetical protein
MKRRSFVGGALAGVSLTGALAAPQKVKAGAIPTTTLGNTGVQVSVIAQGGARMDLHPDVPAAAVHVRRVYDRWGLDILGSGGEDHLRIIAGAVVNGGEMGPFVPLLA